MRESSKGVGGGGGLEISDFMNFHSKIVEKRPHPPSANIDIPRNPHSPLKHSGSAHELADRNFFHLFH